MNNTIEALPYPFDPARVLREANSANARKIYRAALAQAERNFSSAAGKQMDWPDKPNLATVTVQPVRPLAQLIAPKELEKRTKRLQESDLKNFFTGVACPVPGGVLYENFNIGTDNRNSQIMLGNGLVCHAGSILRETNHNPQGLYIPLLVSRIALCARIGHQLHSSHTPQDGMALSIVLENLGSYQIEHLANDLEDYSRSISVDGWTWDYLIPSDVFADLHQLSEQLATIIEEVCWGLGDAQVNRRMIGDLNRQLGLKFAPQS